MADDRLKIELFAEQPDIVTPTGIAVDTGGRVLVIVNGNTLSQETAGVPGKNFSRTGEEWIVRGVRHRHGSARSHGVSTRWKIHWHNKTRFR